jgi:orotate phosphoribosyltransferase-like protein
VKRDRRSGRERRNTPARQLLMLKCRELDETGLDRYAVSKELNLSIDVINRIDKEVRENGRAIYRH